MKEKIYTIPVTDAFNQDCECPLCLLDKKLEDSYIDYVLGPSLMEPDGRIETNEKGFCLRHFEKLYNSHLNSHGMGLIMDTYLQGKNALIKKLYEKKSAAIKKDTRLSAIDSIANKVSRKQTETGKFIEEMLTLLSTQEIRCTICDKKDYTMSRYIEVIFFLWSNEKEFRELFKTRKGFCMKHLKLLLEGSKKNLSPSETAGFITILMDKQLESMSKLQADVNWFTKKFDYRNNDAPWGDSKDAVQRSIRKIAGNCDLK
jgi:hypothetical protein